MKMRQIRNNSAMTHAMQAAMRVKVKDGIRALPVVGVVPEEEDTSTKTFELHCDHVVQTYELITPRKAQAMLARNDVNRAVNEAVRKQYTEDMKNGDWTQCVAPIAIYEDGNIADGQHRLLSIIASGESQHFVVARGLRKREGLNIDAGFSRSAVASAKISGIDPNLTSNLLSAARSIEEGVAVHGRSSNAHKLSLVDKHRSAATFAVRNLWGKKLANGAIMGAVGRAWYKVEDKDKLARFCEVLRTGQSLGMHESAAVTLRNYFLSASANLASSALWVDTFYRTQHAIRKFMDGKQMLQITAVKIEAYPL